MKKHFISLILIITFFKIQAQQTNTTLTQASVEKHLFGVQTGLSGIWVHHELGLSNSIALRMEVGFDVYLDESVFLDYVETNFGLTPVITVEPRWYYNLKKRSRKDKNISKNSGNFLSLEVSYNPNLFTIFDRGEYDIEILDQVRIIPTWGIKRTYWQHFTLETGTGLGLIHTFESDKYYIHPDDVDRLALRLYLRLGYTF